MFLVFNKTKRFSHLLLALSLLFFSFKAVAHEGQEVGELDTTTIFHESETHMDVLHHFEISDQTKDFLFEVYYLYNHGEPFVEDTRIIIGYKFNQDDFRRLSRKFDGGDERQYCSFKEPFVVDREIFAGELGIDLTKLGPNHKLGREGDYLILPVYRFNETLGSCDLNKTEYEVFSMEALREALTQ